MSETASPARANRDGHPCPPWCEVDHETDIGGGHRYLFHGSETTRIKVPGKSRHRDDEISVRVIHGGYAADRPHVGVGGTRHGADGPDPQALITLAEAEHLAGIVEMLAKATAAQHRELAAAIRAAAAQVTEETDANT